MSTDNNPNTIFGIHPVKEALRSKKAIDRILVQQEIKSRIFKELGEAWNPNHIIPVQKVPKEALNKITKDNHQGIIAYLSPISYSSIEAITQQLFDDGKVPFILMLDHITDVRNFGAIVRSAEAMGVDAILIPTKGAAKINAEAIKSSSGAIFHIPICRYPNLIDATDLLSALGLKVIAATEKGHVTVDEADLTGPIVLVMGSEEKGITRSILKRANVRTNIAIEGKTESLNVSVATGIMLYEITRQRKK
ncbi:MAG: 23S rRNA (guanosine(2251)-2'-O)-methyltransferase RlmB [Bacteroidetes bacterium]|nr:MAG: 23S rRNA (guanosine(2251)-2'-O)-methyltransferase RlmB [Bacteroidota bacterium]